MLAAPYWQQRPTRLSWPEAFEMWIAERSQFEPNCEAMHPIIRLTKKAGFDRPSEAKERRRFFVPFREGF